MLIKSVDCVLFIIFIVVFNMLSLDKPMIELTNHREERDIIPRNNTVHIKKKKVFIIAKQD